MAAQMHRVPCEDTVRSRLRFCCLLVVTSAPSACAQARSDVPSNFDASAVAALAQYAIQRQTAPPWALESVNIEASLPKLAKHASLSAIRKIVPAGDPVYEQVQPTGDRMVTREVIERYLTADRRTSETPTAAVAMTPANYKFAYQGSTTSGDQVLYRFRITPRKRRLGLLKGELWLNHTGIAVRQVGYFVKQPSVLIRRMFVTRVLSVEGSDIKERVTQLSMETRVFGPVDLVITERPCKTTLASGLPD